MKKLIAKLAVSAAIIGMLFTGSLAHATTPVKAIIVSLQAGVGSSGYEFDVNYIDPTQSPSNVVIGDYVDAVYFGTDITAYTPSELVTAVETKAIAYATAQGWSLTAADFTLFTPTPFTTTQINALSGMASMVFPSSYQTIVSQTGTSAPAVSGSFTPTSTYSSGVTFTWARTGAGTYTLTASSPVFNTSGKTGVFISPLNNLNASVRGVVTSSTVITVTTAVQSVAVLGLLGLTTTNTDALLSNTMIYIQTYP